ncbi:pimeloyl-ACP methyl ester carboxylesterase [Oxalobacteraceae bacterium GrIS 1.11]
MAYPKIQYCIGQDTSVLHCNRAYDKTVNVKPDLPGNVILIHGVNDVGTSFAAVEEGLCLGLDARMHGIKPGKSSLFTPGKWRMPGDKPNNQDKDVVEADPDAIFFKRHIDDKTHSPLIPFYWGYRETFNDAGTKNGQRTDRYGNRMDKDLSKNGGPFGNATSSLPDMWNRGMNPLYDAPHDPVRPLLTAPGRMYMVLAAKRMAALVSMIRDYDQDEVVTIVAHSQGCLISLLAQAFLLDEGLRPADTLILMHPPYSLAEDTTMFMKGLEMFKGGSEAAMKDQYDAIAKRQTFDARLQTFAKIVQGVVGKKHTTPALTALTDHAKYYGMVGAKWTATADRDNRGKVYLYFCPEDMTVALDNMQGIGWQGVPDFISGTALSKTDGKKHHRPWGENPPTTWVVETQQYKPLSEIGTGFFQRVFTSKKRMDPVKKAVGNVLVGQPPHDFALRIKDEDDHAHVAAGSRTLRANHHEADWPPKDDGMFSFLHTEAGKREGIRKITGEALHEPALADLRGTGQIDPKDFPKDSLQAKLPANEQGPCEEADPIDAAIAVAGDGGLNWRPQEMIDDPRPTTTIPRWDNGMFGSGDMEQVLKALNKGKEPGDQVKDIKQVSYAGRKGEINGDKLLLNRYETPNEARKRWQHEVSPKSFHGAIIGSKENHRNVTAYDVAIGGGKASSDPNFYQYLCAVADWRLQSNVKAPLRPSILVWDKFLSKFGHYFSVEPAWRTAVIEGNANYYSTGLLPACVPSLRAGLPSTVICETVDGIRTVATPPPKHGADSCVPAGPTKKAGV